MRTFLTLFGGLVVMGLVIISVFANFWFGTLLISGQERFLYGLIFGLLDALKTVLVPAAGFAIGAAAFWRARAFPAECSGPGTRWRSSAVRPHRRARRSRLRVALGARYIFD